AWHTFFQRGVSLSFVKSLMAMRLPNWRQAQSKPLKITCGGRQSLFSRVREQQAAGQQAGGQSFQKRSP
ncbi:hypothetical protein NDU88_005157, partial [Pleurodeles waltl]